MIQDEYSVTLQLREVTHPNFQILFLILKHPAIRDAETGSELD
jgi:hypothetical protein